MKGTSGRLLLVEDSDAHAKLFMRAIQSTDAELSVDRVSDGAAAVTYLEERGRPGGARPDLVVLDLGLPRLDGTEVLQRVKGDAQLAEIPVVVLTTASDRRSRAAAYRSRANGYVVKPTSSTQWREMAADLCRFWLKWNRTSDGRRQRRVDASTGL